MATLATPSAKSHEQVTGRWSRDLHADSKRDWTVYYIKLAVGTPVPYLFGAFLVSLFVSRAAVEITVWATALLTLAYIIADRFASEKEFEFTRLGSDLMLLGFFVVSIIGVTQAPDLNGALQGIGSLRWIPLVYLLLYSWQLFPGVNRMFKVLMGAASAIAVYAVVQHFIGLDVLRQTTLEYAPLRGYAYSIVIGLFRHEEILGTLLALVLPIPVAAFMLAEANDKSKIILPSLGCALLLATAVFWTYFPGLWVAAGAGVMITLILAPKRHFTTLLAFVVFFSGLSFVCYGSPESMVQQVVKANHERGIRQRAEIQEQVKIWEKNSMVGAGMRSTVVRETESLDGNLYFQLLAQTGTLGLAFYLLFSLNFLLSAYRTWREIPRTHYWHKVLVSGGVGALAAFHVAGLYWPTLSDSHAMTLFVLWLATISYLGHQYDRGLVPDDHSL